LYSNKSSTQTISVSVVVGLDGAVVDVDVDVVFNDDDDEGPSSVVAVVVVGLLLDDEGGPMYTVVVD